MDIPETMIVKKDLNVYKFCNAYCFYSNKDINDYIGGADINATDLNYLKEKENLK